MCFFSSWNGRSDFCKTSKRFLKMTQKKSGLGNVADRKIKKFVNMEHQYVETVFYAV